MNAVPGKQLNRITGTDKISFYNTHIIWYCWLYGKDIFEFCL